MDKKPQVGELREPSTLKAHPRNSRKHSEEQIDQLAASIARFGFTRPIVVDEGDTILAGHGVALAALKIGLSVVPVVVMRGWSEAQKRAYVIADNKLPQNSTWDVDLLKLELIELDRLGIAAGDLGFMPTELDDILTMPDDDKAEPSSPVLGEGMEYRIVLDCADEADQAVMLERFQQEGRKCRALMS